MNALLSLMSLQASRFAARTDAEGAAVIYEDQDEELSGTLLYHSLLGELYTGVDDTRALGHFEMALGLARRAVDKNSLTQKIGRLGRD